MQRIRVSGPDEVASLLRTIADGVAAGRIGLGGQAFSCSERISAVVEAPDSGEQMTILTMLLHFGEHAERRPGQVVEQELTHPGG